MNTMKIAGKSYSVQGELPNGFFYLEGPRGGALLAKPAGQVFTFHDARKGGFIYEAGVLVTATREQLAA